MAGWFAGKRAGGFPVIGAVDGGDSLVGFATFGAFRPHPAYKYTVEHSVYVHRDQRGRGLGRHLLAALVDAAVAQDYHVMIGAIDADNAGSIALHEALGFRLAGRLPQVGFKFGRWLDLALYQRILATPAAPIDG
jgi:phosphinothricin acetyltransferase